MLFTHFQKETFKNLLSINDDIRISSNGALDEANEPSLVILDTGLAIEETPQNLQKLRLLFRAVVEKKVGHLSTSGEFCEFAWSIIHAMLFVVCLKNIEVTLPLISDLV